MPSCESLPSRSRSPSRLPCELPSATRKPPAQKPPAGESREREPRVAEPRAEPRVAEPKSGSADRDAECARLFARLSIGENNQELIDRVKTLRCR